MKDVLYTVGHSNHTLENFIKLLRSHSIDVLCDVRSTPHSRITPQFNKDLLENALKKYSISYLYLGDRLGARSKNPLHYADGRVSFKKIAEDNVFLDGIRRLKNGIKKHQVAIMCSEKDPLLCHRAILICRSMKDDDLEINHILYDGRIEGNRDLETRLMNSLKISDVDLFESEAELINRAYDVQAIKIAYESNELL